MGTAIRSKKTAQENQDNVFLPRKLRKTHTITVYVGKLKIRGVGKNFHGVIPFRKAGFICQAF
jgi:hypothetical protein